MFHFSLLITLKYPNIDYIYNYIYKFNEISLRIKVSPVIPISGITIIRYNLMGSSIGRGNFTNEKYNEKEGTHFLTLIEKSDGIGRLLIIELQLLLKKLAHVFARLVNLMILLVGLFVHSRFNVDIVDVPLILVLAVARSIHIHVGHNSDHQSSNFDAFFDFLHQRCEKSRVRDKDAFREQICNGCHFAACTSHTLTYTPEKPESGHPIIFVGCRQTSRLLPPSVFT